MPRTFQYSLRGRSLQSTDMQCKSRCRSRSQGLSSYKLWEPTYSAVAHDRLKELWQLRSGLRKYWMIACWRIHGCRDAQEVQQREVQLQSPQWPFQSTWPVLRFSAFCRLPGLKGPVNSCARTEGTWNLKFTCIAALRGPNSCAWTLQSLMCTALARWHM